MSEIPNKYTLDVEEIYCEHCRAITGHALTGRYYTCVHCGYQQGKEKTTFKKWCKELFLKFKS